jgi:hypothetical protein
VRASPGTALCVDVRRVPLSTAMWRSPNTAASGGASALTPPGTYWPMRRGSAGSEMS